MLLFAILFFIFACIIVKYLNDAGTKGKAGEKMVAERLSIIDGNKYYEVL